jgi:hypothetical protein
MYRSFRPEETQGVSNEKFSNLLKNSLFSGQSLRLPKIDLSADNLGHPLTFARLGLAAQASEA